MSATGYCRIPRSVVQSWPKLRATTPPSASTTCSGARFLMPRKGMKVNAAHQIAAESMLIRTASSVESPTPSWKVTSRKFSASSSPPPA